MSVEVKVPKKLIEVALPLDEINREAAREKSIRHGHPSTMHLWWARRPLAAARAVIFAQLVNDPGGTRGWTNSKSKKETEQERNELFEIITELVKWENIQNKELLAKANEKIKQSWQETCEINKNHPNAKELFSIDNFPALYDPFAGGGAIPIEAQRLGVNTFGSDLNPVAVLINKCLSEYPFLCLDQKPICQPTVDDKELFDTDVGVNSLAKDVFEYSKFLRNKVFEEVGNLFPPIFVTKEMVGSNPRLEKYIGRNLTIVANLWARTVKSPSPAFSHLSVPLVSSYILSTKKGSECFLRPVVNDESYRFEVVAGKPTKEEGQGTKVGRGGNFKCLLSEAPITVQEVRSQGIRGELGQKLLVVIAEGDNERVFLSVNEELEKNFSSIVTELKIQTKINDNPRDIRTQLYGLTEYGDLFTPKQLIILDCFVKNLQAVKVKIEADYECVNSTGKDQKLTQEEYSKIIISYLALAISKLTDRCSTVCSWDSSRSSIRNTFGRQALPMTWDFAEPNPFSSSTSNFMSGVKWIVECLKKISPNAKSTICQLDAVEQDLSKNKIISTDPPYYDNIAYGDLADYFYVWLRKSLINEYPGLFQGEKVPKEQELVASAHRHGSKENAENFFLDGMSRALQKIANTSHPGFPITIYYAFKQSETKGDDTVSTGWETFLEAVIKAGFEITGTWPMRTEMSNRMVGSGANALASSIVLVCRKSKLKNVAISRREFQRRLKIELPDCLDTMIGGDVGRSPVAPVDLAQAAIGPGISIYSQYKSVLNQDGTSLTVHDSLKLINREISYYLEPDAGDFDSDTIFCSNWFQQYGWKDGNFGEADTLARAKGISVEGVQEAGVIVSGSGRVRLLKYSEYNEEWRPEKDSRTPIWEACHHLIRILLKHGEAAAGELLAKLPDKEHSIRQLGYHLYTICEKKKWSEDAGIYNNLILCWDAIEKSAQITGYSGTQTNLFDINSNESEDNRKKI